MTVSTIATIASGLTRALSNPNTKASAALESLIVPAEKSARADVAQLNQAIALQNQVAQFRVASKQVAQAGSLLSAADAGAAQIAEGLQRLKELATKATSASLSQDERKTLDGEFSALRAQIDAVARNTKFNGESLLDGSSKQLKVAPESADVPDLSVSSFADDALFPKPKISILQPSGAEIAVGLINKAIAYVESQRANIASLQDGLGFASATLQSAIQNRDAANSTLTDADLVETLLGAKSVDFGAGIAQTKNLPTNILQLLSE